MKLDEMAKHDSERLQRLTAIFFSYSTLIMSYSTYGQNGANVMQVSNWNQTIGDG